MGFRAHCGLFLLAAPLLLAGIQPRAFSQATRAKASPRLAEVRAQDQGLAVLGAALESRHELRGADCSHAVHGIYQHAGLPYSYVTSHELYAGTAPFRRVARPLPGDLVVWPGHVGIVVNARNHSFYSSFSSGLGVEDYDSDYWRARGQRRFFRYVKSGPVVRDSPVAVIEPVNSTGKIPPPVIEDRSSQVEADPPSVGPVSDLPLAGTRIPVVRSTRPTADDVQKAVLQSFQQTEDMLRGRNVLKAARAVIIFDEFQVHKVHVKKDEPGWIEVRISEPSSLVAGRVEGKKRSEKLRWTLTRAGDASWQVQLPLDTIYLARPAARRILAHQLATLTERSDRDSLAEQAQLAHALDAILQ
jgi:hypothetical protein